MSEKFTLKKGKQLKFYLRDLYQGSFWDYENDVEVDFDKDCCNMIITRGTMYLSYPCDRYEVA